MEDSQIKANGGLPDDAELREPVRSVMEHPEYSSEVKDERKFLLFAAIIVIAFGTIAFLGGNPYFVLFAPILVASLLPRIWTSVKNRGLLEHINEAVRTGDYKQATLVGVRKTSDNSCALMLKDNDGVERFVSILADPANRSRIESLMQKHLFFLQSKQSDLIGGVRVDKNILWTSGFIDITEEDKRLLRGDGEGTKAQQ